MDFIFPLFSVPLPHCIKNPETAHRRPFSELWSDLLMKPEHSETKAKTETRECETETETKYLLWDRDQKLRDQDRDRDQSNQVNWMWK